MLRAIEVTRPYPGLRPFETHEAGIFYGRDTHVDRLLEILKRERFLAVIGPSGCGKSSLVRAGLLPGIAAGWVGGKDWRMVVMRPGDRPLKELARRLLATDALGHELEKAGVDHAILEAELARGPRGLIDVFKVARERARNPEQLKLLVLVDQFEELFTYANAGDVQADESSAFVDLLLQSRTEPTNGIHIVLTMRTDFLGHCVRFLELPDAINRAQFLTPRLNRDEMREAIVGPARLFGRNVDSHLIGYLINGVGGDSDQLPILQHVLSRMWEHAGDADTLTEDHLKEVGGLLDALSKHATDVYDDLTPPQQHLAEHLFRFITGRTGPEDGSRDVRRPRSLQQIAEAKEGTTWKDYVPVVEAFAADGVNFLTFTAPLDQTRKIDISHEALIRKWDKLQNWVTDEAKRAAEYREWHGQAMKYERKEGDLLSGVAVARALAWEGGTRGTKPDPRWAARYASSPDKANEEFESTLRYIAASRDEDRRRRRQDAVKAFALRAVAAMAVVLLVFVGIATYALMQRSLAREEAVRANEEAKRASKAEREAREAQTRATVAAGSAMQQKQLADDQRRLAEYFRHQAERNADDARRSADDARRDADRATRAELTAKSRNIITESEKYEKAEPDRAQLLAIEAWLKSPNEETEGRIRAMHFASPNMLVSYRGHEGTILNAAFSPDGHTVVTAGEDGTTRLWDRNTGRELRKIKTAPMADADGLFTPAADALFTPPAGRAVLTLGEQPTLWDISTGERLRTFGEAVASQAEFSPDGSRLVIVDDIGDVRAYDTATGTPFPAFPGAAETIVQHAAFAPDGTRVVTSSQDNTARVWDVATGTELLKLEGHDDWVASSEFSPDGTMIVTASDDGTAGVWDADTGTLLKPLTGHDGYVVRARFNPDSDMVVTASDDDFMARLWDVETGALLAMLQGHTSPVVDAFFSPDGRKVATLSEDGTSRIWDASDGGLLLALRDYDAREDEQGIVRVSFSPDASSVITANVDGAARLWSVGRTTATLTVDGSTIEHAVFAPDGSSILIASDTAATVWSKNGQQLGQLRHEGRLVDATFSVDGKTIVTAGSDGTVLLWDARSRTPRRTIVAMSEAETTAAERDEKASRPTPGSNNASPKRRPPSIARARLSPDGTIVAASFDSTAKLWSAADGRLITTLRDGDAVIREMIFNRDGTILALSDSVGAIRTYEMPRGTLLQTLNVEKPGWGISFHPKNQAVLLAAHIGGTVRLWNARTGAAMSTLTHGEDVLEAAFDTDGRRIVTGGRDGITKVWDADAGRTIFTLKEHAGPVYDVRFSPDGKTIATAGVLDGTAKLWDGGTGKLLVTLEGHDGVGSVRYSPDSSSLLTAGIDTIAKIWNISAATQTVEEMIAEIRRRVGRELTPQEREASRLDSLPAKAAALN